MSKKRSTQFCLLALLAILQSTTAKFRISTAVYIPLSSDLDQGIADAIIDKPWKPDFSYGDSERIHGYFDLQSPTFLTSVEIKTKLNCGNIEKFSILFSHRQNGHYDNEIFFDCHSNNEINEAKINHKTRFVKINAFRKPLSEISTEVVSIAFFTKFDPRKVRPLEYSSYKISAEKTKIEFPKAIAVKMLKIIFEENLANPPKFLAVNFKTETKEFSLNAFKTGDSYFSVVLSQTELILSAEILEPIPGIDRFELFEKLNPVLHGQLTKLDSSQKTDLNETIRLRQIKLFSKRTNSDVYKILPPKSSFYTFFLNHSIARDFVDEDVFSVYKQNSGVLEAFFRAHYLNIYTADFSGEIYAQFFRKREVLCRPQNSAEGVLFGKAFYFEGESVEYLCRESNGDERRSVVCARRGDSWGFFDSEEEMFWDEDGLC